MISMGMQTGGSASGYAGGRRSPIGIGGAIAVHAVVVGALLLMPREIIEVFTPPALKTHAVPLPPPPPDNPPPPSAKTQTPTTVPNRTIPVIPTTPNDWTIKSSDQPTIGDVDTGGGVTLPIDPPREPVYVEPAIDPRAMPNFQPEYPGAMIRQQVEGSVTVRVTIGPDGRVTDIERLSATNDAFWVATQRQAMRKWRFRAATRDGVAVGGTKVLTVHFRLEDQ